MKEELLGLWSAGEEMLDAGGGEAVGLGLWGDERRGCSYWERVVAKTRLQCAEGRVESWFACQEGEKLDSKKLLESKK